MSIWRTQRQILYLLIVLAVIVATVVGLYFYLYPAPTCSDKKQNQEELGIDCGGPCAKACLATTRPLRVLWTRILPVAPGRYDFVAAIENQNTDRGIERFDYKIKIYDKNGVILADRANHSFSNPLEKTLLFESGFLTDKQVASAADINITKQTNWLQAVPLPNAIQFERVIEDNNFTAPSSTPRLRYQVSNRSLNALENIEFVVLLVDERQNAYAGSRTILDRLEKGETKEIFFTWPGPVAQEPATIDFSWHINGFEQKVKLP